MPMDEVVERIVESKKRLESVARKQTLELAATSGV